MLSTDDVVPGGDVVVGFVGSVVDIIVVADELPSLPSSDPVSGSGHPVNRDTTRITGRPTRERTMEC